ncbi:hypothetical protein ACR9IA_07905 [Leclercia pneumoniae]
MKYIYYGLLIIYHSSTAAVTVSCGGYKVPSVFESIYLENIPLITLAQLRASPYTLTVTADSKFIPTSCHTWKGNHVTINNKQVSLVAVTHGWQTVGTTYFLNLNEQYNFGTINFKDCPVPIDGPQTVIRVDVVNKNNLAVRRASATMPSLQNKSGTWELPATVDLGTSFAGDSLSRNLAGPVGGSGRLEITRPSEQGAHIRLGLNGFPVDTNTISVPEGASWSAHMHTSRDTPPGEYKATVTATLQCD